MYTGKYDGNTRSYEKMVRISYLKIFWGGRAGYFPFTPPDPLSNLIHVLKAELSEHQWAPWPVGCWLSLIEVELQRGLERGWFSCLDQIPQDPPSWVSSGWLHLSMKGTA